MWDTLYDSIKLQSHNRGLLKDKVDSKQTFKKLKRRLRRKDKNEIKHIMSSQR